MSSSNATIIPSCQVTECLASKIPSWKSTTLDYLGDLLLTTVSTVTPLAVGFILISYIHKHYNNDGDGVSQENKDKIKTILKKWNLNPKDLDLNEHEWAIAMNLADPDSLEGVSWTDIAGCENEIQKLKNFVIIPLQSKVDIPNSKKSEPYLSKSILQSPKGVLIHGVAGVGKTLLAKIFAKETNCRLLAIDPSKMTDRHVGESEKLTAAMFTLAEKLEPCVVFIDEIDSLLRSRASNDGNSSLMAATKGIFLSYWDGVDDHKTVLVLGTTNRPKDIDPGFLRRFDLNLQLQLPDFNQRKCILELYLNSQSEYVDGSMNIDEIVYDMSGFSGADIKEICRQAMISATDDALKEAKPVNLQENNFIQVIADSKKSRNSCGGFGGLDEYEMKIAGSLLAPEDLNVEWDDVAGLDEVIERLQKNVILPLLACRNPEILQSGLIQPPKGILLYGEPGCGKTLLAKAIAKYVHCSFINLQPSDLQGTLYGETSKNVRAVFSLAEKYEPCIIFIDEIDALFRKRQSNDHETTSLMKTSFMSLWDGILSNSSKSAKNIIILGATNRPDSIDQAILRRLPEKINIPLPILKGREMILKAILKHELLEKVDLGALAQCTEGLSGSDLKEICRSAAINSVHSYASSTSLWKQSLSKTGAGDIRRLSNQQTGIPVQDGLKVESLVNNEDNQSIRIPIEACHFESALKEFLSSRVR